MFGAMLGDIIGSEYEYFNVKTKDFELFPAGCRFTDDSVMTAAVAAACIEYVNSGRDYAVFSNEVKENMIRLGRKYPYAGYGGMFRRWLETPDPQPYNSYGNGSAMRVSPVGWTAETLEEALTLAELSALPTHNHPEGVKGAKAAAACVFLARKYKDKLRIKDYVCSDFYVIDFTLDGIRPDYKFDVTCQGSVPQAIEAFLEAVNYEDAVRGAVSIGGDSDTIAAIAGGIAEAFFGIPPELGAAVNTLKGTLLYVIYERFKDTFPDYRAICP